MEIQINKHLYLIQLPQLFYTIELSGSKFTTTFPWFLFQWLYHGGSSNKRWKNRTTTRVFFIHYQWLLYTVQCPALGHIAIYSLQMCREMWFLIGTFLHSNTVLLRWRENAYCVITGGLNIAVLYSRSRWTKKYRTLGQPKSCRREVICGSLKSAWSESIWGILEF